MHVHINLHAAALHFPNSHGIGQLGGNPQTAFSFVPSPCLLWPRKQVPGYPSIDRSVVVALLACKLVSCIVVQFKQAISRRETILKSDLR